MGSSGWAVRSDLEEDGSQPGRAEWLCSNPHFPDSLRFQIAANAPLNLPEIHPLSSRHHLSPQMTVVASFVSQIPSSPFSAGQATALFEKR